MGARCSTCATTAPASTWRTPTSCSALSSACTRATSIKARGSGWRRSSASSTGTAAASGPMPSPARARRSTSRSNPTAWKKRAATWRRPRPDDRHARQPAIHRGFPGRCPARAACAGARRPAAEEERARLVEILEATSDYVGMSDPQGRRIYLNAAGRKLTGVPEHPAQGALSPEIYPGWVREIIQNEALPAAARDGLWQGETAMLDSEGKEIPVSQVVIAHRGSDGGIRFFSTIARDISERKAYEKRITYLASYDALSGLPNRSLLGDRTAQAMTHARRIGRPCALIVLDLDRFKLINDSYGRTAGDALLRQGGQRIRGAVRDGDTTARLEAASFAVLAADLARADDVLNVTRKVHELFKVPLSIEGHDIHVTLSIGASVFPRDGDNFDALLGNADVAKHRVKASGGKGFQFYAAAMTREATERIELENALRTAVARRELELHYQPQVDIASGRIRGVEALMRWRHAERGWIPPGRFIPVAEESHLIQPLGDWALGEGCRQLAAWDRAGHYDLQVGINVSAVPFRSAGFVGGVTRALRAQAIDPSPLEVELTESELIDDREVAISVWGGRKSTRLNSSHS